MERSKLELFPNRFDFFGYGEVAAIAFPRAKKLEVDAQSLIVSFRIEGDERGMAAVVFDPRVHALKDPTMTVEIANILVSKFVGELAEQAGGQVSLSPPELVTPGSARHSRLAAILESNGPSAACLRHYEFRYEQRSLGLAMTYVASTVGQT